MDTGRLIIVTAQPEYMPKSAVAFSAKPFNSRTATMLSKSWLTGSAIAVNVKGMVNFKIAE